MACGAEHISRSWPVVQDDNSQSFLYAESHKLILPCSNGWHYPVTVWILVQDKTIIAFSDGRSWGKSWHSVQCDITQSWLVVKGENRLSLLLFRDDTFQSWLLAQTNIGQSLFVMLVMDKYTKKYTWADHDLWVWMTRWMKASVIDGQWCRATLANHVLGAQHLQIMAWGQNDKTQICQVVLVKQGWRLSNQTSDPASGFSEPCLLYSGWGLANLTWCLARGWLVCLAGPEWAGWWVYSFLSLTHFLAPGPRGGKGLQEDRERGQSEVKRPQRKRRNDRWRDKNALTSRGRARGLIFA
jgi:hypothetical protein